MGYPCCLGCSSMEPDLIARTCYCLKNHKPGKRRRRLPAQRGEQICLIWNKSWSEVPRYLYRYSPTWCPYKKESPAH